MRRVVWLGVVLIVASAGAVYMAADYAARHPNSYLGRCAAAAVYISARSNPVTVAADMVRGERAHLVGRAGAGVACGALAADCGNGAVVAKPIPGAEDPCEEPEAAEPAEVDEPIQPQGFQQDEQEPNTGIPQWENGQTLPVVPTQTEEPMPVSEHGVEPMSEFDPAVFNRAVEDEKPMENGTEEAPYYVEVETYIPEAIPTPTENEDNTDEPANEECPCLGDKPCTCAHGCGCWFAQMLKAIGWCADNAAETAPEAAVDTEATPEATSDSPEILELPLPCDDDEPQEEGVEEQPIDLPPTSTIPSYDHYHHGGCPYMGGGCPYYRGTPIVTPVEIPRKIRVKKKKKQHQAMYKPVLMEKIWKQLLNAGADEEEQEQMGIDTMEFRPSDDPRDPPGHSPF